MPISSRIRAADAAFAAVRDFYFASRYGERRLEPGISDFTFGNPHEMPLQGIVSAIRDHATAARQELVCLQDKRRGAAAISRRTRRARTRPCVRAPPTSL